MEIQSAFNAGVQGFQRATEDANQAAVDINQRAASDRAAEQNQQGLETPATSAVASTAVTRTEEPAGITDSIVKLKVAEVQARSSAEVIQTADETLGTLIDVSV